MHLDAIFFLHRICTLTGPGWRGKGFTAEDLSSLASDWWMAARAGLSLARSRRPEAGGDAEDAARPAPDTEAYSPAPGRLVRGNVIWNKHKGLKHKWCGVMV